MYQEGHFMLSLPDADEYILEVFHVLGLCSSNGMGHTPLSWVEIDSFRRNSNYVLLDSDCEIISMMSRLYLSWLNKGKDPACFSPWDDIEAYNASKAP